MTHFIRATLAAIALASAVFASAATAQEAVLTPFAGSFDDATFAVESTIVGRGLVIDYVSHTGEMLARTGEDVGSDVALFDGADVFLFCSAALSREVMEKDPLNIAHCPYNIFVFSREGQVQIGHRTYPEGAMQKVESLLADIVAEAAEF